jgi:hypothetical protein
MALSATITFTPNAGRTVSLYGSMGVIHPAVPVVDSWRRPGATAKGYQTTGSEAPTSTLEVWHSASTEALLSATRADLCALAGRVCVITRTGRTAVRAVVVAVRVKVERRTAGSGAWRLEADVDVEALP